MFSVPILFWLTGKGDEDDYWNQNSWQLKGAKMVRVDGEIIKPDTYYTMKNGEVVEAEE